MADTEFEAWLAQEFERTGPFTALIVLTAIQPGQVTPLCSTYANVVGPDVNWEEMSLLLAGSGLSWDGVVFFVATAEGGGALPNVDARTRLREVEEAIRGDRLRLNDGHFFNRDGRRLQVEAIDAVGHA
jgi:hypothetical protein